jgi:hypothetical protein
VARSAAAATAPNRPGNWRRRAVHLSSREPVRL